METLVWAAVAVLGLVLAYRAVLAVAGKTVARQEDVTALAQAMDARLNVQIARTNEVRDEARQRLDAQGRTLDELVDRVDAIDQRTAPDATVQTGPGRAPRRML